MLIVVPSDEERAAMRRRALSFQERDAFAMAVFKELVPYLNDEDRAKFAAAGKSTTYKAAQRAWDAALEWKANQK